MCRSSKNVLFLAVLTLCFLVTTTTSQVVQSPPTILKSPENKLSKDEEPFTLECEAKGVPVPEYRWTKNGENFDWQSYSTKISQEPGYGTLHFTQPTVKDEGQYQCFAFNSWGTATSNSARVVKAKRKRSPENILVSSMQVEEGKPFQFYCGIPTDWPKPLIYWVQMKNPPQFSAIILDDRMTLDSNGTLWFSYLTKTDTNDAYTCKVVYEDMTALNGNQINLTVVESTGTFVESAPIKQYVTRKNETAVKGETAELFCIYSGNPVPQTNWSKNGSPIQNDERIKIVKNGKSLLISNISIEDKGTYTCKVDNGIGLTQSYNIELDIMVRPYFTIRPKIVEKEAGQIAEIVCEANGYPIPEIIWIHNGRPLSEETKNSRRNVSSNSIKITDLVKTDTGNYGCNATNSVGYVYQDVYINVSTSAPIIFKPLQNIETVVGKSVTMVCGNIGAPMPRIRWTKNHTELSDERYLKTNTSDLQIRKVELTDNGYYTCFAENDEGTDNAFAKLTVKERTQITARSEDTDVLVGSIVTFYCNATTDPSLHPNIVWLFDNEPIDFNNQSQMTKNDNHLTIPMVTKEDSGNYTCVVKTELDNVTTSVKLSVKERIKFTVISKDTDVLVGSTVIFYCNTTTDQLLHPNIEWFFNNEPIDFDNQSRITKNDNHLSIFMATKRNTGNYTCMVKTELDNATASVKLSVKEHTKITAKSDNTDILVGSTAIFYCTATTDPLLHSNIEWFFDNEPIDFDNQSRITKNDNNLSISMITKMDTGNYTCVVKTELDNATASVKLSVKERTKFTVISKDTDVLVGSTVIFYCNTTTDPSLHPKIEWLFDNEPIDFDDQSRITKNDNHLSIYMITKMDTGNYTCVVNTELDNVTASVKLSVKEHTKITAKSDDTDILVGSTAIFYCTATTDPLLHSNIEWFFDNEPIDFDNQSRITKNDNNLSISMITKMDTGSYTCVVKTELDNVTASVKLSVKERTKFTVISKDTDVLVGSTVIFYCNTTTDPSLHPKIEWLFDNEPIDFDNQSQMTKNDNHLTILMATKRDTGNYTCIVKTELDNATASVKLSVKEHTKFTAKSDDTDILVGTAVKFYCNATTDPSLHSNIVWFFDNESIDFDNQSRMTKNDNLLTISMVTKRDTGNYTCLVKTELDNITASVKLFVKERTIINVEPKHYEANFGSLAYFYCNATTDQSLYPNIEWLFNNEPMHFNNQSRITKNDNGLNISMITEMDSGNYTCVAKTKLDNESASAILIVQKKPNPPKLLEVTCYTNNATVKWQPNSDNRAPILHYSIEYNNHSFAPDTWLVAVEEILPSEQTFIVPMKPWTNSTFRVTATNKVGKSDPSVHSNICITKPDVPYKNPDNVKMKTGSEPSTLIISWTPLSKNEHNAPGLKYRVDWKVYESNGDWNSQNVTDVNKNELELYNLLPNKLYRVKVVAFNEMGECNERPKEISGSLGDDGTLVAMIPMLLVLLFHSIVIICIVVCILKRRGSGIYFVGESKKSNIRHKSQNDLPAQPLIGQNGTIRNNQSTECETLSMIGFDDIVIEEGMSETSSFIGEYGKSNGVQPF